MAPQALLSRGNTGERAAAAVCCARGAPASTRAGGHVGRIIYDLPLFSRVWDKSGGSGPWEDGGVLLSPPPTTLF